MKLQYKQTDKHPLNSIYVHRTQQPYLGQNWHFHEEYELIYFLKGHGMRIVGDHISNFKQGELVLVGQWLPHLWRNDEGVIDDNGADFIVVKFSSLLKGVDLFSLPELGSVKLLLKRSMRGLYFSSFNVPKFNKLMINLANSTSSQRLILFLEVLEALTHEKDYHQLSSPDFTLPTEVASENRLQKVINHIFANYQQEITLDEISGIAFMTSPAFCRYFKNRTNKTFFNFLNEFRVNKACLLLINQNIPVKRICYDVGFRSLTNFNRTFRKIKKVTPTQFRSSYRTI